MNWGTAAEWAAILVTAAIALWAGWIARQTRDETRRQANESAHANILAQEANDLARQSNGIARKALALAEEAAVTAVTWQIHNDRGHQYLLTNVGTGTAYNVVLDYAGVLDVNSETDEVKPQGQVRFMAFATSGGTDQTITVTYSDSPEGERLNWAARKPGRGQ